MACPADPGSGGVRPPPAAGHGVERRALHLYAVLSSTRDSCVMRSPNTTVRASPMMLGKMLRSIKRLWVTIGIALLILIALEALAWLAYATRDNRRNASLTRLQATQAYAGAHWFEEYARELSRARAEWRSYTYWREAPYHGKFINIDERGLRRTWNRSPAPSPGDLRVYMLGGSGMWGLGARDDFTIPSLVSKKLNSAGVRDLW